MGEPAGSLNFPATAFKRLYSKAGRRKAPDCRKTPASLEENRFTFYNTVWRLHITEKEKKRRKEVIRAFPTLSLRKTTTLQNLGKRTL